MEKRKRNGMLKDNQTVEVGELMTTREAAARMRLSTDTLTVLALRGKIASIKLGTDRGKRGGKRLYPVSEVELWLSRNLRNS